jgi:Glycosyl transferase family 2
MQEYLLTISIPVYNRKEEVEKLLESIVLQKSFNENINLVEVVITDNASTDWTFDLVKTYSKKFPNIHIYRNNENIGMTRNFIQTINNSVWKYVWLFWSDDLLASNSLTVILEVLQRFDPDLLLNKYTIWSSNMNWEYGYIYWNIDIKWFHGLNDFINYLSTYLKDNNSYWIDHIISFFSYISIFCFRRDLFWDQLDLILSQEKISWSKKLIENHYFNWSYILYSSLELKKISLLESPSLTLNVWWGANPWKMSLNVLYDALSIISLLRKWTSIDDFFVLNFMKKRWIQLYFEVKIYNSWMTRFLQAHMKFLYNIWRSIYLFFSRK